MPNFSRNSDYHAASAVITEFKTPEVIMLEQLEVIIKQYQDPEGILREYDEEEVSASSDDDSADDISDQSENNDTKSEEEDDDDGTLAANSCQSILMILQHLQTHIAREKERHAQSMLMQDFRDKIIHLHIAVTYYQAVIEKYRTALRALPNHRDYLTPSALLAAAIGDEETVKTDKAILALQAKAIEATGYAALNIICETLDEFRDNKKSDHLLKRLENLGTITSNAIGQFGTMSKTEGMQHTVDLNLSAICSRKLWRAFQKTIADVFAYCDKVLDLSMRSFEGTQEVLGLFGSDLQDEFNRHIDEIRKKTEEYRKQVKKVVNANTADDLSGDSSNDSDDEDSQLSQHLRLFQQSAQSNRKRPRPSNSKDDCHDETATSAFSGNAL